MTPEELFDLSRRGAEAVEAAARQAQRDGQDKGRESRYDPDAGLGSADPKPADKPGQDETRRAASKLAEAVGMSRPTYDRVRRTIAVQLGVLRKVVGGSGSANYCVIRSNFSRAASSFSALPYLPALLPVADCLAQCVVRATSHLLCGGRGVRGLPFGQAGSSIPRPPECPPPPTPVLRHSPTPTGSMAQGPTSYTHGLACARETLTPGAGSPSSEGLL